MKIGEAAARLGTTPRTLRFYEERGLLRAARSGKGTRFYSADALDRVKVVLGLAALGIPLEEMSAVARARADSASGDQASREVCRLLEPLRHKAAALKAQCAAAERELERAGALAARCFGCGRPPTPEGCRGCPTLAALREAPLFTLILEQEDA